jgi:hypothetical protein
MRAFLYTFIGILGIKLLLLMADGRPAYFFGDSGAYLSTATAKYIPPDRSFLYGLLIRRVAYRLHCLQAIIGLQVFVSAVAAWLISVALAKVFRVRLWLAITVALLCSIEPLQLLSERYILTESWANFLFALHFTLILIYLRTGRAWCLLTAQLAGVMLIAFRIGFLPIVVVNSILPPVLAGFNAIRTRRLQTVGLHICLAFGLSQGLLTMYEHWYGRLIHREPALFYQQGAFLVAAFSPLIEPDDFPDPSHRDAVFKQLKYDPHNIVDRPAQHFLPGGIWPNISKEIPDEKLANEMAIGTTIHAALRQPVGVMRLAVKTYTMYFDLRLLRHHLLFDEGADNTFDPTVIGWLQKLYGISDPHLFELSPIKLWHLFAVPWYWLILVSLPIGILICVIYPHDRPLFALCGLAGLTFLASATLLVDNPTPRFLTSAAWFVLLMFGIATEHLLRSSRRRAIKSAVAEPAS